MAIHFCDIGEAYEALSNHSPHPIEMDGVVWPTVQHRFQAMKFPHEPELQERIRLADTPDAAKRVARGRNAWPRPDWEFVRDAVMLAAVREKFGQHADARAVLLSTGDGKLVQHSRIDPYWADGGDGSGLNKLGRMLMLVRWELRGAVDPERLRWVLPIPDEENDQWPPRGYMRHYWEIKPMPAGRERLPFERSFTPAAFERLRLGHFPHATEDMWFVFFDGDWLNCNRSWGGHCIFKVRIGRTPHGCRVEEAWVNRDPKQHRSSSIDFDVEALHDLFVCYFNA